VAPTGPGERAVLLPWLLPDAGSFHALIETPNSLPWSAVRADPGLLFFLLARDLPVDTGCPIVLDSADKRVAAGILADSQYPWADWRHPSLRPVVRTALAAGHFAELLADATETMPPARAWVGGWLAFAGWLAVGAVEPAPGWSLDPFGTQKALWGMTRADVAWRLSSAWKLPLWAQVVCGRLDASPNDARRFGGDPKLQALIQIAVVLAEQAEARLYVADEFDLTPALAELELRSTDLDRVRERYAAEADLDRWLNREWRDPRSVAGLVERLVGPIGKPALREIDEEPTALLDVHDEHMRAAKLSAVAEFAAGASHEINNPLAVISGHSQYLLRHETDERRRDALESIVRQTGRIHSVLLELMFFARPPVPKPERTDLSRLVRDAAAAVTALAGEREVEIQAGLLSAPLWVEVDPKQINIALTALIRNGVEAAPVGGWVRVSTAFRPDRLEVIVEDSGPGPDDRSRDHLFDPFYSGRAAGRGRGLGLPAAWRLAKEHGGDVRYVPLAGGPTRFVLSLPASAVVAVAQRKSA
jgi:two-component system, NtrC family, sensor kinase